MSEQGGTPEYPTQAWPPPGQAPAPPSYLQQPAYGSYGTAAAVAPPPPAITGPAEPRARGRGGMVAVAVLAGLLLLGAGFGLGRLSAPSGPASLFDALRMTQQGTLPCGSPAAGNGAGFLARLCQLGPGRPGVPGGPGGGNGVPGNAPHV